MKEQKNNVNEVKNNKKQNKPNKNNRFKSMMSYTLSFSFLGCSVFGLIGLYDLSRNEAIKSETVIEEPVVLEMNEEIQIEEDIVVEEKKEPVRKVYPKEEKQEPEQTTETTANDTPILQTTETEIAYIAKTMYGEARGSSKMEMAAVAWCILNRVDKGSAAGFADSIIGVITQPYQFHGYNASFQPTSEIWNLAVDVVARWEREKRGETNVGRVLPKEYLWFWGDGKHNHFQTSWRGGYEWNWSLPNPYGGMSY